MECNFRCDECNTYSSDETPNCKADKCAANRTTAPYCPCPAGYYEETNNPTCLVRGYRCAECSGSADNCTVCAIYRSGLP
jgi:hypothetical protein